MAVAAQRQHSRGGGCGNMAAAAVLLPPVSLLPPYLSLNSKMENTVVKIVSYQYIPNWNCLLFN